MITKSSAFLLYNELINVPVNQLCHNNNIQDLELYIGPDIGQVLRFSTFCIYLIRISDFCY